MPIGPFVLAESIVFLDDGAVVIVKWSKMRQDRRHIGTIRIPLLGSAHVCPVKILNSMLKAIPHTGDAPLSDAKSRLDSPFV